MVRGQRDDEDDDGVPDKEFTEHELEALHEMLRDYDRAKWLRGQMRIWIMWCLGIPAAVLGFITALDTIIKLFKGGKG